jgi:hypothetical protein
MSKHYPGKSRARKAYQRGLKTGKTRLGRCPYRNVRLAALWERGFKKGSTLRRI